MKVEILEQTKEALKILVDGAVLESIAPSHSSRKVYKFKDFVVKVSDRDQNENEINFYKEVLQPEDARFFPKMLASGVYKKGTFIVQERVDHKCKVRPCHVKQFNKLEEKYGLQDTGVYLGTSDWNGKPYESIFNAAISTGGRLKIFDIGYRRGQW